METENEKEKSKYRKKTIEIEEREIFCIVCCNIVV